MVGKKGRSGGMRQGAGRKSTGKIQLTVKLEPETVTWLKTESLKRLPQGKVRPEVGPIIDEAVRAYRERGAGH